jgi:hypothetical protein
MNGVCPFIVYRSQEVVSGREGCRPEANGISARQPVPAGTYIALRDVFYRQNIFRTQQEVKIENYKYTMPPFIVHRSSFIVNNVHR